MTIVELLNMDVAKLEAMSDKELEAHCRPFFNITRPELAEKPKASSGSVRKSQSSQNKSLRAGIEALLAGKDLKEVRQISKGQI